MRPLLLRNGLVFDGTGAAYEDPALPRDRIEYVFRRGRMMLRQGEVVC